MATAKHSKCRKPFNSASQAALRTPFTLVVMTIWLALHFRNAKTPNYARLHQVGKSYGIIFTAIHALSNSFNMLGQSLKIRIIANGCPNGFGMLADVDNRYMPPCSFTGIKLSKNYPSPILN